MVTNVHITRILGKITANDFVDENDAIVPESLQFTDRSDSYPDQNLSSWDLFLTGQQSDIQDDLNKQDRKFPIRIFTIQPEV